MKIEAVHPVAALPGAEVTLTGEGLGPLNGAAPIVTAGGQAARTRMSREHRLIFEVPEGTLANPSGESDLHVDRAEVRSNTVTLNVAEPLATDIHAVANPAIDELGNIYTTLSGPRGQKTPVSVIRILPSGDASSFLNEITNATGLAFDPEGYLYVSSRNDGTVYRVSREGAASLYAEGMGVATGLAFDASGNLYVGDRSGTIFKIARDRQIFVFATLEPSVAAYHLAFGPEGTLYVTAPSTTSNDCIWAVDRDGTTRVFHRGLGRPQGLAFDRDGNLYVAASWQGQRGIVRLGPGDDPQLVVAGAGIVGLAFRNGGSERSSDETGLVIATSHTIYHLCGGPQGLRLY
jgi:sugar lactone lactonase YvrE